MDRTTLALHDVRVSRGPFTLGPVSARLPSGCTALLGANGAGKTTLLQSIVGLGPGSGAGEVELLGPDAAARGSIGFRRQVGYLPQQRELPRFVRVEDLLAYAAELKGIRGADVTDAVTRSLDRVGLDGFGRRFVHRLSGGEQQRVSLAAATVHEPALAVLDEPTAGLDPVQRIGFRNWLGAYCQSRSAIVSTHIVEDVLALAACALVLDRGQVAYLGPVDELGGAGAGSTEQALLELMGGQR